MKLFTAADILLPKTDPARFAVIACDQHTSEPSYWQTVKEIVGDAPSALSLILPEAFLGKPDCPDAEQMANAMQRYLDEGVFLSYPDTMVYVERTLSNGACRRGIVGALTLAGYDYRAGANSPVRATEKTVTERIPARLALREKAPLELPHVLMLCDTIRLGVSPFERLNARKASLPKLYDFDLMLGGGHITGYRIDRADVEAIETLFDTDKNPDPFLMAVGDGNHSLAAAKAFAASGGRAAQQALIELTDIHDPSLTFAPIYRLLCGTTPAALLAAADSLTKKGCSEYHEIRMISGGQESLLFLPKHAALAVSDLQDFLDDFMAGHRGVSIDYIHGEASLAAMTTGTDAVGFLFDGMRKEDLFAAVAADGALVRKTFSMGEAADKRYYLEARKIVD